MKFSADWTIIDFNESYYDKEIKWALGEQIDPFRFAFITNW